MGTLMAVLQPYMRHARDDPVEGRLMLRCDNPQVREWRGLRGVVGVVGGIVSSLRSREHPQMLIGEESCRRLYFWRLGFVNGRGE